MGNGLINESINKGTCWANYKLNQQTDRQASKQESKNTDIKQTDKKIV